MSVLPLTEIPDSEKWIIIFDDASRGMNVYGTEAEARDHYERYSDSWNCHLFAPVSEVDRLRSHLHGTPIKETK